MLTLSIDTRIVVNQQGVTIIDVSDATHTAIGTPRVSWFNTVDPVPITLDVIRIDRTANTSLFVSEPFDLSEEKVCTLLLSATNDDNAFGLDYQDLNYVQFLRVPGCIGKDKYTGVLDPLLDSKGVDKIVFAQSRTVRETTINAIPLYLHTAIRLLRIHDTFTVDGIAYTPTEIDYDPDWQNEDDLSPVTFDLEVKSENNVNTNCQ